MIQRPDHKQSAQLLVRGSAGLRTRRVESAVASGDSLVLSPDKWTVLDDKAPFGHFQGFVNLVPGWNRLYLRTGGDAGWYAHPLRIGVGEVFLVAGQSNASGRAFTLFIAGPNVRLGQVDGSGAITWKTGDDPQVPGGGGSVWPEVGRRLYQQLGVPIAFVNVAVEASFLADWKPGGADYNRLVKALAALGPQSVRAVLWHQGESDARTPEAEYYNGLKQLIASVAKETPNKPVRWLVATASFDGTETHNQIRVAQQRICEDGFAMQGPDTDSLGPDKRDRSRVHFSHDGTLAAAVLWYESIARNLFPSGESVDLRSPALN